MSGLFSSDIDVESDVLTVGDDDPLLSAVTETPSPPTARLVELRAQLKGYSVKAASNGLNYTLHFEVSPGFGEDIGRALATGACRLWWHPEGATSRRLISEGAIPASTGYAQKYSDDGRHDMLYLKLTRGDVPIGVGSTVGTLYLPEYEQHGTPGMLGLEPNQQDFDLV